MANKSKKYFAVLLLGCQYSNDSAEGGGFCGIFSTKKIAEKKIMESMLEQFKTMDEYYPELDALQFKKLSKEYEDTRLKSIQ